jgi:beta-N-acetylhexosaminidase
MSADLERAALRVLLPGFAGTRLPDGVAGLLADGLGGICLFGSNTSDGPQRLAELTGAIHEAGPDAVVAVDEEGGDVSRLHPGASPVLGAAALGAAGDLELTREAGWMVGQDLAAAGIDLDLGPVADVNSQPDNPVIGTRSFGAEPAHAAAHVAAWIQGLQASGVAACTKHFPGHGDTIADSHVELPLVAADRTTLEARELLPFRAAVEAGVAAVMTSHLLVPALDAERPTTFSPVVTSVLREELGFDGLVVTDALDMAGASAGRGIPQAAVLALAAGADLLCLGPDKDVTLVRAVQDAIVEAVKDGRLPEQRLVEAATRIARLGRFPSQPDGSRDGTPAQRQLEGARRALRVEGELPSLAGARIVSVDTPSTIAIGEVEWGLAPDLVVTPDSAALPVGVPLVVQVRDAHRQPAVVAVLDQLERSGAAAVVVEWGWPGARPTGLPRICTFGCSLPTTTAVAEVLATAGWAR